MQNPIEWESFVCGLHYKDAIQPSHAVRRWLSYTIDQRGVHFCCAIENGEDTEGYPGQVAVRLDVIYEDVLRLRMSPTSFRNRASDMLVIDDRQKVDFQVVERENHLEIYTNRIRVEVVKEPWQISAFDLQQADSIPFFRQRVDDRAYGPGFEVNPIGYEYSRDSHLSVHEAIAVRPGESIYGLGEKFTSLDKWGQEHRSWAIDSGNVSSYRSYKNIPFFMTTAGYGIFVHSSFPIVYRMGSQSNISYSFHVMDTELDYFLIYGPTFKQLINRYTDLTGKAPVPPKWSFGFWIGRCGYKTRAEVEEVIQGMRSRDFPCDVIHLDPWWMGQGPWTTLTWDTTQFPDPVGMMGDLRKQGVRTCLWIHAYLPKGSPIYQEAAEKDYLVKALDGSPAPVLEDFSGVGLAAVDFTNPEAKAWYQDKLQQLLAMGVAVFKTDFGEQAPIDAMYADGRSGLEMHNLYPLIYNQAVFELTRRYFGRGLTWGRSAYAGSQRYPTNWGGDSYSSVDQLASQVRGLLSFGMSGMPFCSHDIGGFDYSPCAFDAPLQEGFPKDTVAYIRWLQVGVFSSHSRAHGKQPREPWTFGEEAEKIARKYLKLRYRLLPYIYSQAVQSSHSSLPVVRPLVLEYQDDPNVQRIDLEYLFGDVFLVAPTLSDGSTQKVYLPRGNWVDYWTKEVIPGERWLNVHTSLEKLPLWVKEGSILPLGPEMDYVDQKPLDPLTLELYVPTGSGETVIFDEDKPEIHVQYASTGKQLEVGVDAAPGDVEVVIYGVQAASVVVNGYAAALTTVAGGQKVILDGRKPSTLIFELA